MSTTQTTNTISNTSSEIDPSINTTTNILSTEESLPLIDNNEAMNDNIGNLMEFANENENNLDFGVGLNGNEFGLNFLIERDRDLL
jgi:hypothetical protein